MIGSIDQELVAAAWKEFRPLLTAVIDRKAVWRVGTSRSWTVKNVRQLSGDPSKWRILTPTLEPRFKEAGVSVRPQQVVGANVYTLSAQKWGLEYLVGEISDMPSVPVSLRFQVLDRFRRGLPLTSSHVWYQFSGMALGIGRVNETFPSQVHSFGYGNDNSTTWVGDGSDEFERRLLSSLTWRIARSE